MSNYQRVLSEMWRPHKISGVGHSGGRSLRKTAGHPDALSTKASCKASARASHVQINKIEEAAKISMFSAMFISQRPTHWTNLGSWLNHGKPISMPGWSAVALMNKKILPTFGTGPLRAKNIEKIMGRNRPNPVLSLNPSRWHNPCDNSLTGAAWSQSSLETGFGRGLAFTLEDCRGASSNS